MTNYLSEWMPSEMKFECSTMVQNINMDENATSHGSSVLQSRRHERLHANKDENFVYVMLSDRRERSI